MKTFILAILFSSLAHAETYTATLTAHETEDGTQWVSDNHLVTINEDTESMLTLEYKTLANQKCFISNASEEFIVSAECFVDKMNIRFIRPDLQDTFRPIEISDGSSISIIITGEKPEVCTDKCIKQRTQ